MQQRYLMFCCHARSGHTLVASILDAHPDIVIANEWSVFESYRNNQWNEKEKAIRQLLDRSRMRWPDDFYIGTGHQSSGIKSSFILGEKRGQFVAEYINMCGIEVLEQMHRRLKMPFIIIQVIRNPWDCVASMAKVTHRRLDDCAYRFWNIAQACSSVIRYTDTQEWVEMYQVYIDLLCEAPLGCFAFVGDKLGLDLSLDWVRTCGDAVKKYNRSSEKIHHQGRKIPGQEIVEANKLLRACCGSHWWLKPYEHEYQFPLERSEE